MYWFKTLKWDRYIPAHTHTHTRGLFDTSHFPHKPRKRE